jgi:hypothetical protein
LLLLLERLLFLFADTTENPATHKAPKATTTPVQRSSRVARRMRKEGDRPDAMAVPATAAIVVGIHNQPLDVGNWKDSEEGMTGHDGMIQKQYMLLLIDKVCVV